MNLKLDYIKNLKITDRFQTTMTLLTMSGVLALTGCGITQKEYHFDKADRMIYEASENDELDLENEKEKDSHEESFDSITEQLEDLDANLVAEFLDEVIHVDPELFNIDLSFYEGNSLEKALILGGYNSSYDFRKQLAKYLEINDYTGTSRQNLLILQKLGAKTGQKYRNLDEGTPEMVTILNPAPVVEVSSVQDSENEHSSSSKKQGSSSSPSKIEHVHKFGDWYRKSDTLEERKCSCGAVETRNHTHKLTTLQKTDSEYEYWVCGDDNQVVEIAHKFCVEFNATDGTDIYTCENDGCDYSDVRTHQHSEIPEDLEYTFKSSNHDGTHVMSATYTCSGCAEEIENCVSADCDYGEETYRIFSTYNSYNQHDVVTTCNTCGYEKVTRGDCVKTGDLQYIKIGPYPYEYYSCALCNGYVDRKQHTEHTFGEWEIDDYGHIRYCGCIDGREEGDHFITFDDNNVGSCRVCGYTKETNHEHAKNGMDYMDLVIGYFDDLKDYSPVPNPNPSADDFCYSLGLVCSKCHTPYVIIYEHEYGADGVCTLGKCDVVDPNYDPTAVISFEDDQENCCLEETIQLYLESEGSMLEETDVLESDEVISEEAEAVVPVEDDSASMEDTTDVVLEELEVVPEDTEQVTPVEDESVLEESENVPVEPEQEISESEVPVDIQDIVFEELEIDPDYEDVIFEDTTSTLTTEEASYQKVLVFE